MKSALPKSGGRKKSTPVHFPVCFYLCWLAFYDTMTTSCFFPRAIGKRPQTALYARGYVLVSLGSI